MANQLVQASRQEEGCLEYGLGARKRSASMLLSNG
ncbi:hypothetical protein ACU4GD_04565 [Cupriavidus basilensis]